MFGNNNISEGAHSSQFFIAAKAKECNLFVSANVLPNK